ncbi:hypothetical protein EHQ07_15085 [Leptospira gomenensis]|nr:hypothetical protein EHQ07_15085 [Leptospira gomenensis]
MRVYALHCAAHTRGRWVIWVAVRFACAALLNLPGQARPGPLAEAGFSLSVRSNSIHPALCAILGIQRRKRRTRGNILVAGWLC